MTFVHTKGLAERIAEANEAQELFNDLPDDIRAKALYYLDDVMDKFFRHYNLECVCADCNKIMDSQRRYEEGCAFCDSVNIASEYYC